MFLEQINDATARINDDLSIVGISWQIQLEA